MWSAAVLEPTLAGLSRSHTGSPEPGLTVIDERHQRMMTEGLLPGWGASCCSECASTSTVDVHDHLAVGGRTACLGQLPDSLSTSETCAPDRRKVFGPDAASASTMQETVGSDATGPSTAGSARSMPTWARQSPPSATDSATSSRILPRIVHSPRLAEWCHRCGYRGVQGGLVDRVDQQHGPGLGNDSMAVALETDTWVRPAILLHLQSDSFLAVTGPSINTIVAGRSTLHLFDQGLGQTHSRKREVNPATNSGSNHRNLSRALLVVEAATQVAYGPSDAAPALDSLRTS